MHLIPLMALYNIKQIYYILFFLHFRYTLKKYNINAIWFLGEIIPLAPPWKGLFNPTINKNINY